MLACGEKEAVVMAPPPTCDSAVSPCFHGCLAFLHQHFLSQSPHPHPIPLISLCSQQQPSHWYWSTITKLQLPATAPSRGPTWHMYGCGKYCLILIPFRPPQIRCFTLSLQHVPSDSHNCPTVGIRPLLGSPTRQGQVQSY